MSAQVWVRIDATIYMAEYIEPNGAQRPFWHVTYSYRVDNEYYSGEFTDFATDSEVEYHKQDSLVIEYSKTHPSKSRVPSSITFWSKARLPSAIGGALGLAAIILYILSHRQPL